MFTNGLKDGQGVLDVHFEVDAAQHHQRVHEAMEVDLEDTEATVERDEDEDEADFILDSSKTTDDILDHRSGISTPWGVPFPICCSTLPIASINLLSMFSPIMGMRHGRNAGGGLTHQGPWIYWLVQARWFGIVATEIAIPSAAPLHQLQQHHCPIWPSLCCIPIKHHLWGALKRYVLILSVL